MESILTSSGLTVCYQGADYDTIARALKRRDPRLLLDKDCDDWGRERWVIKLRAGDNPADWPVFVAWVDPDMTPRELSMGIVEQLDRQEVKSRHDVMSGKRLAQSADRVRERIADEGRQEMEDIYREHEHRLKAGHGKPVTISTPLKKEA